MNRLVHVINPIHFKNSSEGFIINLSQVPTFAFTNVKIRWTRNRKEAAENVSNRGEIPINPRNYTHIHSGGD